MKTKQNQMEQRPRHTFRFASEALKKAAKRRMKQMSFLTMNGYINGLIQRDTEKRSK